MFSGVECQGRESRWAQVLTGYMLRLQVTSSQGLGCAVSLPSLLQAMRGLSGDPGGCCTGVRVLEREVQGQRVRVGTSNDQGC